MLLPNLTAYVAAHVVTYLQFTTMPFAPTPPAPPTLDFGGGHIVGPIKTVGQNLLQTTLYIGAVIAFIGAAFLALRTILGSKKWGGRAVAALLVAVVLLAPAVFFGTVQNVWNSLSQTK